MNLTMRDFRQMFYFLWRGQILIIKGKFIIHKGMYEVLVNQRPHIK